MRSVKVLAAAIYVFLVCSPGIASAQTKAETARAQYKDGKAHYQLGEYREALQAFKEAYRLIQDPAFLFNVAQCHRQLHEYPEAIRVYGAYLRDAPNAANRTEVERLIRDASAALEREQRSSPPPAATSPARSSEPDSTGAAAPAAGTTPPTAAPAASAVPPPPPADASPSPPEAAVAPKPSGAVASDGPSGSPPAPSLSTQPVARPPAPVATPTPAPATASPQAAAQSEAELEVLAKQPQAAISINNTPVGQRQIKLKLPPGLYSVSVDADGFQSARGAVALMAGDQTSVTANLLPVRSHGWRKLGHVWLVLAVLGEGAGIVGHVKANQFFTGSEDFEGFSKLEKVGQTVAVSAAVLATGCYVLDWLRNRGRVEPGSHSLLEPTRKVNP